jgi:HEAT repeat protein
MDRRGSKDREPERGSVPVKAPGNNPRRKCLFSLIVSLAGLLSFAARAANPTYEGKPASFWLDHIYARPDGMRETIQAFKAMGTNAVPFLIKTLERKPSKLSELVDDQLYKDDLARHVPKDVVRILPSAMRVEGRREHAAFLIKEIGPDAAAAIPVLMAILNDQTEGWRIVSEVRGALLAMGEKLSGHVPEFIAYLKSDDRETRQLGALLLASTGPKAQTAVPALLEAAESREWGVSHCVAQALWKIDHQTNVAVGIYTNSLQSTNSTYRQLALIDLRQMGPAAKAAGPQVKAALNDSDDLVRQQAEKTLREIDADLLQSSLQKMNEEIPAAVARLTQMIQSGEFKDRFRAVETIAVFGPDSKPAVPALIGFLSGPGPQLPGHFAVVGLMNSRRSAAEALAEIGPEARAAVPALIDLLKEHRDYYRAMYCKALGNIGPDAKEAVPVLEDAMRDDNLGIRLAAAVAVTKIAPEQSSNAVGVLKNLQADPELATVWTTDGHGGARQTSSKDFQNPASRFFRLSASVPLWRLRLERDPPVTGIIEELNRPSRSEDIRYVELLGDIGPDAKAALPALEKFLNPDQFISLRRAAAIAIRRIDPSEAAKLGLPGTLIVP